MIDLNYYIADLHFGHKNVISLVGLPFASVDDMDSAIIERWNEKVQDAEDVYIYVIDGNNRIILCHYPICEWNGFHNGVWHIYGHIHCKRDDTYLFMKRRERALNAGCMINNYVPVNLGELIENNRIFKEQGSK